MDSSQEIKIPGGEVCGSAYNPDDMGEKTTTYSPPLTLPPTPKLARPKYPETTSSEKDLQKPKGKTNSKSNIPQAIRSFTNDAKGTAMISKGGNKTCASAGPASKGSTSIQDMKPRKNIKAAGKIAKPVSEPNREIRAALSDRVDRLAAAATKPATMAEDSVKKTTADICKNTSRGKPVAGIASSRFLATTMSLSGDSFSRQSARDQLSNINKLKVFEGQLLKLQAVQTEFLRNFEALKGSMPGKFQNEFKFIAMVQDGNCKLVVQEDYVKKNPLKLPTCAVDDFKKGIHDVLNTCLKAVKEEAKNKGVEESLDQEQARRLSLFFAKMNDLCSVTDASEQDVAKFKKQLLDSKCLADDYQLKINQQKTAHASDMIAREKASRKEQELQISKKDDAIADLNKKVKTIQKDQLAVTEQAVDRGELEKLFHEINALKNAQLILNNKLQQSELAHKRAVHEIKHKDAAMAQLQKELEERKKLFDDVRSRNNAEVAHRLLQKWKVVTQLKAALELNKKYYAALTTRKELEAVEETKIKMDLSKSQIKQLKQDLWEQKEELEERTLGTEQCPVEKSSMERMLKETEAEQSKRIKDGETTSVSIGVQTKAEEFEAPCSSLRSKRLEERHRRCEMLRVKQQEEICRLQEEVFAMKLAMHIPSNRDRDEM